MAELQQEVQSLRDAGMEMTTANGRPVTFNQVQGLATDLGVCAAQRLQILVSSRSGSSPGCSIDAGAI